MLRIYFLRGNGTGCRTKGWKTRCATALLMHSVMSRPANVSDVS
jgi:hypothetical protein